MEENFLQEMIDSQMGSSEDLEPEVVNFMRKNMARDLGLPESATLDQIDQAMKKKYLVT